MSIVSNRKLPSAVGQFRLPRRRDALRRRIAASVCWGVLALLPLGAWSAPAEVFQGSGVVFGRDGKRKARYRMRLTKTRVSKDKIVSAVELRFSDGSRKKMSCTMAAQGGGAFRAWKTDCRTRRGGGACFGDGMCIDYTEDSAGRGYATTIVDDGHGKLRLLRTELLGGKAVRFFREKLARVGGRR